MEDDISYEDIPPPDDSFFEEMDNFYSNENNNISCSNMRISEDELRSNPKKLWGYFIVKLREDNYMALHTACGEIREIKLEGNVLKAFVKEQFLYDILTKQENYQRIVLELNKTCDNIKLEFVLKKTIKSAVYKNLEILKSLFGDEIKII